MFIMSNMDQHLIYLEKSIYFLSNPYNIFYRKKLNFEIFPKFNYFAKRLMSIAY